MCLIFVSVLVLEICLIKELAKHNAGALTNFADSTETI